MRSTDVKSNTYIDITVAKEDRDSQVEVCGYVRLTLYLT